MATIDDRDFEITVMTKLTQIETILKEMDYKEVERIARNAENTSCNNKKEIEEIKNTNLWLARSVAGVIIAVIFEAVFKII